MDWLRWILLLIGAVVVAAIWWAGYRRGRERDETLFERARRGGADSAEPAGLEADTVPDIDVPTHEPHPGDVPAGDLDRLFGSAGDRPGAAPVTGEGGAVTTDDGPGSVEHEAHESVEARAREEAAMRSRRGGVRTGDAAQDPQAGERLEAIYIVAARGERFIGSRLRKLFAHQGLQHGELDIFHRHDADGHVLFSVANLVEPGTFDPATMDTLSTPGLALFVRLPGPPSAETAFDRMVLTARALAEELEARLLDQQHSTLTRQTEQHLRDQMRTFDHQQRRGRR